MPRNRNKRSRRLPQTRLARPFPSLSLVHTAGLLADLDEDFGAFDPTPVRSPLIRTVLVEPPPRRFYQTPRLSRPPSPTRQVRATMRSSDAPTRSPFLNATMVTPELTDRALECASRGIRREVLFATKKTGKGAKSPRRSPSKVRC